MIGVQIQGRLVILHGLEQITASLVKLASLIEGILVCRIGFDGVVEVTKGLGLFVRLDPY